MKFKTLVLSLALTVLLALTSWIMPTAPAMAQDLDNGARSCAAIDTSFLAGIDLAQGVPVGLTPTQYIVVGDSFKDKGEVSNAKEAYQTAIDLEIKNGTLSLEVLVGAQSRLASLIPDKEQRQAELDKIQASYYTFVPAGFGCACSVYYLYGYLCLGIC
jgi:hypothetical protein